MILLTKLWRRLIFCSEYILKTLHLFFNFRKVDIIMKKFISLALCAVLILATLTACGTASKTKNTYTIGLCNYVNDASLNQIVENIQSQLAAIGKEKGVTFDVKYQNCNADNNVLNQIVSNFIADDVDLMVGVATPVAMAMQNATEGKNLPVVFSAVTDPVGAELVKSLEAPGANITGTSDYLNTNAIMDIMFETKPSIKKVGLLYDVGQDSSTAAIKDAKAYLEKKGIAYVEKTGKTADEITLAAQALVSDKVDAVFTPTDNSIMTAELSIYEIFAKAGIPHFTGADSFALNGAFLGFGVDYINLGKETANMIAEILLEGKNPSEVAVRTFDNGTATINTEICSQLGMNYDEIAKAIAPHCTKVEKIKTAESFDGQK